MVKRYEIIASYADWRENEADDGAYVEFTDYESIERERNALRAALKESTELLERISNGDDWGAIEEYIQENHEALAKGADHERSARQHD